MSSVASAANEVNQRAEALGLPWRLFQAMATTSAPVPDAPTPKTAGTLVSKCWTWGLTTLAADKISKAVLQFSPGTKVSELARPIAQAGSAVGGVVKGAARVVGPASAAVGGAVESLGCNFQVTIQLDEVRDVATGSDPG